MNEAQHCVCFTHFYYFVRSKPVKCFNSKAWVRFVVYRNGEKTCLGQGDDLVAEQRGKTSSIIVFENQRVEVFVQLRPWDVSEF